jgi:aquaporin NIP
VLLQSTLLCVSGTHMQPFAALLLEALLTFWLQWVYLALGGQDTPVLNKALAVGFTVSAALFWAGPFSSASMNPARSLGPALATWEFSDLWIFLVGPPLGAAAAAFAYRAYLGLGA